MKINIYNTSFLIYSIIVLTLNSVCYSKSDKVETKEEVQAEEKETPIVRGRRVVKETKEDEEEEIVYNKEEEEKVDPYAFSKEWEKRMSDYEPTYVYMIPIKQKTTEKFFENFIKVPRTIKGAFLTEDTKREKIEFLVINPQNRLVYKNNTSECIFEFEATTPGEYTFKFKNNDNQGEIKVTFTINTAQEEVLSNEHLSFTEKKIESLNKFMNNIKIEDGFIMRKQRDQKKSK